MKKTLALLAAVVMAGSAYAQGTITFFSLHEILKPGNPPVGAGAGFTAGLFLSDNLNTPLGTTDFVPNTGYLNAINVNVPGHPVNDSTAAYVVRAWETGKTFATSTVRGESPSFVSGPLGGQNLPNPAVPPPDLDTRGALGFQGFTMVPEPSTYALGVAGLGAVAMMRRRKQ